MKTLKEFCEYAERAVEQNAARAEFIMETENISDGEGNYLSGAEKEALAGKHFGIETAFSETISFIEEARSETKSYKRHIVGPVAFKKLTDWISTCNATVKTKKVMHLSHSKYVVEAVAELDTLRMLAEKLKKIISQ